MDNAEALVSIVALLHVFLALLYLPVGAFCYKILIPRMSPNAKRLASALLALQVLLVMVSLHVRPVTPVEEWLWDIDREWNIPSIFAATQLALVGGIAVVGAWLAREMRSWPRRYLFVIGLLLLFLALDEYFSLKELLSEADWLRAYAILGAALAAATLQLAARSPKGERVWLICLLFAFALMALAGMGVDNLKVGCPELAFLQIDECLKYFTTPEEVIELLGAWLALLSVLGQCSGCLPRPGRRLRWALCLALLLWFALLAAGSPVRSPIFQLPAQPIFAQFEANVTLHGYETRPDGRPISVFLYLPLEAIRSGLGYSAHLVDQASGASLLGRDDWAHRQYGYWLRARRYIRVFQNLIDIRITPEAPVNRALWVVLTLWRQEGAEEFVNLKVLDSDQRLLSDSQLVLGELVLRAPVDADADITPRARFDNGFSLVAADLPERAAAGDTLAITFGWRADEAGREDLSQFLHFVHAESGALWNIDQLPLGARLPTRLWYEGLADSETWGAPLPAELAPGRYDVFTGLYRLADLERIAVYDGDGTPYADARVPLGSLLIE